MIYTSTILLATALFASASASASASVIDRRASDNGSCQQQYKTCAAKVDASLDNVFSIESCLFAASCFGGQRPVDDFLASLHGTKGGSGTALSSVSLARVTTTVFNAISTDGKVVTQQNFIDGYYGQLAASNGPYPSDSSVVVDYYNRLTTWTAFCSGQGIPYTNFADYYQYSASVSSPGCDVVTADCQEMFNLCLSLVSPSVTDIFAYKPCALGATCDGSDHPIASFITGIYEAKNPGSTNSPTPLTVARLTTGAFGLLSQAGGPTMTQQSFIDAWFSQLAAVGGPYPPNADLVISYFQAVLAWAGFCPGQGIPYINTTDYFEYSSAVQGVSATC